MSFLAIQQKSSPLQIICRLTGQDVRAAAVISCQVTAERTAVTAFIVPKDASAKFRHAIDMELAFTDTLLAFDEVAPPFYGTAETINLQQAACEIGVDRVLCIVTMTDKDQVFGIRDYDGVEVTVLEAATQQLTKFKELLGGMAANPVSRRLQ